MTTAYTQRDALGIYQTDTNLSGKRIAIEVDRIGGIFEGGPGGIVIDCLSDGCGTGEALLQADTTGSLKFKAPGGTFGTSTTIAAGETKMVPSGTASKWVRVTRVNSDDLGGTMTLTLSRTMRRTVAEAQRSAGVTYYEQFILRNHSDAALSNVKCYVSTLGTQYVSGVAQLSGSGSGTIQTASNFTTGGWPSIGYCRIEDSGGTLKEIVYYSSRTTTTLTVPANGRGLLGTSATAGASSDKIYPVPGIALGVETPDSNGLIQAIASETTAPSGITWDTDILVSTGPSIGTISTNRNHGLWVKWQLPADAESIEGVYSAFAISFDYGGTTYVETFKDYCRVLDDGLEKWNVYIGEDEPPDFESAPTATGTSFPITSSITPPVSGTKTVNVALRRVNDLGIESLNTHYVQFIINSSGDDVTSEIGDAVNVSMTELGAGVVELLAEYDAAGIDDPADTWLIYSTTDGTDPDPGTDTPEEVAMQGPSGISPYATLRHIFDPLDWGTELRVIVRVLRSSDNEESINETIVSQTIATQVSTYVHKTSRHAGQAFMAPHGSSADFTLEEVYSVTHDVKSIRKPGVTELRKGTTVIWRALWPDENTARIHIPAAFTLINTAISGTGTADPVEVVSATEIYICVDGTRRVKIDLSAMTIEADVFGFWDDAYRDLFPINTDIYAPAGSGASLFQAWDLSDGEWKPYMIALGDGSLVSTIPVVQRSA